MESTLAMVNVETQSKEIVEATNPSGVTIGGKDPAVVKRPSGCCFKEWI